MKGTEEASYSELSHCDVVGEFASLAPTAAVTIVQEAAMMMLSSSSCISAMFFLLNHVTKARDGEIYSRQQSYSKSYNISYNNERIAVQQSYNLLTAISLDGVRPLYWSFPAISFNASTENKWEQIFDPQLQETKWFRKPLEQSLKQLEQSPNHLNRTTWTIPDKFSLVHPGPSSEQTTHGHWSSAIYFIFQIQTRNSSVQNPLWLKLD